MIDPRVIEIQSRLDSYLMSKPDVQGGAFQFRMSASGLCPRLMDYQIQRGGKAPPTENSAERMDRGKYLHTMWQERMQSALGPDFQDVEQELVYDLVIPNVDGSSDIIYIVGHIDGYVRSVDATYELKTVSEYTYHMVEKNGKPLASHYEQGNFYAYSKGVSNILFHYYNASNGQSLWYLVPKSDAMGDMTANKFRQRILNSREGLLEKRPYTDATASPCWFCEKVKDCYKDFKKEVDNMSAGAVSDVDFTVNVSKAAENRTTRLKADKVETLAKSKVAEYMIKHELKECVTHAHKVKIKIGKNNNPSVDIKPVNK